MNVKKGDRRPRFISARNARPGTCKKCQADVLIGPSDDQGAFTAWVDPIPLGPVGEFLAQANGRRTYAARRAGRFSLRLYQRDRWQIAGRPAGTQRSVAGKADVFAEHACGQPLPGIESCFPSTSIPRGADDDNPPF